MAKPYIERGSTGRACSELLLLCGKPVQHADGEATDQAIARGGASSLWGINPAQEVGLLK